MKNAGQRFELSTQANADNRDSQGLPLPKPPSAPALARKATPRLALDQMLERGRRHAAASISSLLRFRRLILPAPAITALRQPVKQFRGLGLTIQVTGLLIGSALWWAFGLIGAAVGAGVCFVCYRIGRAKSKPWRCGNCGTPLATAKVRVCPVCGARMVECLLTYPGKSKVLRGHLLSSASPIQVIE